MIAIGLGVLLVVLFVHLLLDLERVLSEGDRTHGGRR